MVCETCAGVGRSNSRRRCVKRRRSGKDRIVQRPWFHKTTFYSSRVRPHLQGVKQSRRYVSNSSTPCLYTWNVTTRFGFEVPIGCWVTVSHGRQSVFIVETR